MLQEIKNGNVVKIEGVLSEIDLKKGSYTKDGITSNIISGDIKVRVDTKINGIETELEVPIRMFAKEKTNAGTVNPAYSSLLDIMTNYVSIAASNYDAADRVRITNARITMNEYYNRNDTLVSFPSVSASFVNKINKDQCNPTATFNMTFMVGQKTPEVDKDGIETGRYKVIGMVPQYGGRVDVVPFYAENPGVIDGVSNYWNEGDTVKATGVLNFSTKVMEKTVEVDFGEPTTQAYTVSVHDLILTGGSSTPFEGDFAIKESDVKEALEQRKANLAALREKAKAKGGSGHAPTSATPSTKFSDLGF